MDDLVKTQLQGRDLMDALRKILGPESSIDSLLDSARAINTKRTAQLLETMNFHTKIDMVIHMTYVLKLTPEDQERVFACMDINTMNAYVIRELIKFIEKPVPPGCFTGLWERIRCWAH